MKFRYLKDDEKDKTCCYQEYDKEHKRMNQCGEPAKYVLGKDNFLCEEHGRFVGSVNTKSMDNKTYKRFKNDR